MSKQKKSETPVAAATTCSACGGSGDGPPMYRPEIDKVQRDRCYTCQGTGTTKPPSNGSMLRCYWAFLEYFPWKKSEFPTYDLWICSDADDARIFRQGWAARCRTLESEPNADVLARGDNATPNQSQPQ